MSEYEYQEPNVWDRLAQILCKGNQHVLIYVYRLGPDDRPVKPYLQKCELLQYFDFLEWLRDTHGSGQYRLLIRRGRTMVFSGNIGIE
jgi:hypothetical protein